LKELSEILFIVDYPKDVQVIRLFNPNNSVDLVNPFIDHEKMKDFARRNKEEFLLNN